MPEMTFDVRWPDGTVQSCYSPSLVIHDHVRVGVDYPVDEFVDRVSAALTIASERVKAKFGFYCTSAAQTLEAIESTAASARGTSGTIRVLSMSPASVPTTSTGGNS
ncbi:MSMEG_0570 family nitrogen starvation response protein [Nocardia gamkensis]|uniref:MSMEG_0570 family nitrogen starvation response protein n=1 Tax=Nocardia gamkensis TaxID=352869 RepID=UPI0037C95A9E